MSLNGFGVFTVLVGLAADADRDNSLDGINTVHLDTGVLGWVQTGTSAASLFWLDKSDSTTTPDGVTVIQPLTGPGRWKLLTSAGGAPACTLQLGYASPIEGPQGEDEICLENTSEQLTFFFPSQQTVQGAPMEVVFPAFTADNVIELEWTANFIVDGADQTGEILLGIAPALAFPDGAGGETLFLVNNFAESINFVEDQGYRIFAGRAHVVIDEATLANGPPTARLLISFASTQETRIEVRTGVVNPDAGQSTEVKSTTLKASEVRAGCVFQQAPSTLVAAVQAPGTVPFCVVP